jgi:hypothetical protein
VHGDDLTAMAVSGREAIDDVLRRVESQVRIAEAVALYFRQHGIRYQLIKFCSIPVAFKVKVSSGSASKDQSIVIGELGADVVPEFQDLRKRADENPWGTVVQFVRYAPQIKGFGSTAFFLKKDLNEEIPPILETLFAGELSWRGRNHWDKIETAFVWYDENCRSCGKRFARCPFVISGHLCKWEDYPPQLVGFDPEENEEWTEKIVRIFEKREGIRLGVWRYSSLRDELSPMQQACPYCGHAHDESLVSRDTAVRLWSFPVVDWSHAVRVRTPRWAKPGLPPIRRLPPTRAWTQAVEVSRRECAKIEQERRQQEEEYESVRAQAFEDARLRREAQAAAAEADRVEAARRQREEEERARAADQRAREDDARSKLWSLAVKSFDREDLADLWMRTTQPTLNGCPSDLCVNEFEKCARLLPSRYRR